MKPQARSAYRALLREHPRRNPQATYTTPLHNRLRELFRSTSIASSTSTSTSGNTTTTTTQTKTTTDPPPATPNANASVNVNATPTLSEELASENDRIKIQEAGQLARYARAQRTYAQLLERYNPGIAMDEEERIRLTARRVGWELPVVNGEKE